MAEFSVIGKRVPLAFTNEMVTGTAKFPGDIQFPGMLYAKLLMSPYPHANIKSIDTSKAEALPGVKAVVTHKDCAALGWMGMDRPVISATVRYVGDIVAAVAATDKYIAEEAVDLIEVDYETLPFVLDPVEALEPGALQVHPEITENNVVSIDPLVEEHGNVEQGFAEADYIVEDTFTTPTVSASAAEPRMAIASWDAAGKLTAWLTTQGAHDERDTLCTVFNLPKTKVRCIQCYSGGGFGNGKGSPGPLTALLSKKAGRPVLLAYTTREEIVGGIVRHAGVIKAKMGLKQDGTVTAIETETWLDTGAYASAGIGVTATAMEPGTLHRLVRCENVLATGYPMYTNKHVSGAYRGYGSPQGWFPMSRIYDMAAEKLNMDPVKFAQDNMWASGEESRASGGDLVDSFGMPECIQKATEAIGWQAKWKGWDTPVAVNGAKRRGIGIGFGDHVGGGGYWYSQANVVINVQKDGTVQLMAGAGDVGQGPKTTLAQVCAETLGVLYEDVSVIFADTDTSPYTIGTYASRCAHAFSVAVKAAGEKAKGQILEIAARLLEVTPEELEAKERKISVIADPSKSVMLSDVLAGELHEIVTSAGTSSWMANCAVFGAHCVELEVDTETGAVEILKVVAAHDCGTAINPTIVENQIYGGLMQGGLGYALTEDIVTDPASGAALNANWLDYKVKTALDTPDIETPILVPSNEYMAPYGIKGAGEMVMVPTAPAVLSAIRNAIGVQFKDIPVTPDMILNALGKV